MKSTSEIKVSDSLICQVIGQEKGVELIKKAAAQKRNVLLIGEPGTGKSMLAQAMAELLPVEKLQDTLIYPNAADENNPKVVISPAGAGKKLVEDLKKKSFMNQKALDDFKPGFGPVFLIGLLFALSIAVSIYLKLFSDVLLAAFIIVGGLFMAILIFASAFASGIKGLKMPGRDKEDTPKLLIDNANKTIAPFVDATGARSGALLGDVRHDPYQTISGNTDVIFNGGVKKLSSAVDEIMLKYPGRMQTNDEGYEGLILPSNAHLKIYGVNSGVLKPVKIIAANRKKYKGKMVKVTTESGKELMVTPEHGVCTNLKELGYTEAGRLKEGDEVFAIE